MNTIRAFIAVDIGDAIRGKLDELQRRLKKVHANVRWIRPRSMHLTLVFLGDVPVEQVDRIRETLSGACTGMAPFDLTAAGTGFFGKPNHPRVIWVGLADSPPLMELHTRIAQRLNDAGIVFDRKRFSPHLTLGRIKRIDRHTAPLLDKVEEFKHLELGSTRIDHVELIQSTLTPRGAEYAVLHRVGMDEEQAS